MKRILIRLLITLLIFGGLLGVYRGFIGEMAVFSASSYDDPPTTIQDAQESASNLVEILPVDIVDTVLNAVGSIELAETQQIMLRVNGEIQSIAVQVGDIVTVGSLLATLETSELERSVAKAEVELALAQLELVKQAGEVNSETQTAEQTLAEANLLAANENLAKVKLGPSPEELAAAQSNFNASWAKYNSLLVGPSPDKITMHKANLQKAEVDLQEAQRAYDGVAWQNDVGMTAESARLQKATIEYERVKAEYEQANQPTAQADLLSALSSAQKAEDEFNRLKSRPSLAEIAEAQAKVADAEAKLAKLQNNEGDIPIQNAELRIKKALIDLEEAQSNLRNAQVFAPTNGVILELKAKIGERVTAGTVIATIGDPGKLKLTVNVAEVDVNQIVVGQKANITLDAIRNQHFEGIVETVALLSQSKRDVINYPVTVQLVGENLQGVRSGMTAVATFDQESLVTNTWLAPTTALQSKDGKTVVTVIRNNIPSTVMVDPGTTQGEWTYITSTELQAGDMVMGDTASFVDQQAREMFGG